MIGAGLAGSEAAWQLAQRGIPVELFDMKPGEMTPAHHSADFGELVCSNSLRSAQLSNGAGLLKEEMRRMGSLIIEAADATQVPAGGALAVDREGFARHITQRVCAHPLIEVNSNRIDSVPEGPCIVATGPLTAPALAQAIARLLGMEMLSFYDASAPIVTCDSIDMSKAFRAARYGKGDADYINCPMDEAEYRAFYQALVGAETVPVHEFEENKVFEGCMPIESIARRGEQTMAYGPMRPVGLRDPRTDRRPYAVVQLRQDDAAGTLCNLVGFQTRLTHPEQKRVFSMIPGLENASFVRFGVMHRNTFIHAPGCLTEHYQCRNNPDLFFAGQLAGVEGYGESTASGLIAGLAMAARLLGLPLPGFTAQTMMGAMSAYVSNSALTKLEPMNANFGLLVPMEEKWKKNQVREKQAERALKVIENLRMQYPILAER